MRGQGKKKRRLIRYLLYLVLVSGTMTSVTLARYASTGHVTAAAVVASFSTGGSTNFDVALSGELYPGAEAKVIPITVSNYKGDATCEVELEYDIQVETTGNLPLEFSLRGEKDADDSNAASILVGPFRQAEGSTLKWGAEEGRLPQGEKREHRYELVVAWPAAEKSADYSGEIDMVSITVNARQAKAG